MPTGGRLSHTGTCPSCRPKARNVQQEHCGPTRVAPADSQCGTSQSGIHDAERLFQLHWIANHGQMGTHMLDILAQGQPLFQKQVKKRKIKADAYLQLDTNFGCGACPQIMLLDEVHEMHPNSTPIMNFRPILDWIRSATNWRGLVKRFGYFNIPGLVFAPEHRKRLDVWHATAHGNESQWKRPAMPELTHAQLAKWWCGHVLYLREYVQECTSHALIELDLCDTNGTMNLFCDLFESLLRFIPGGCREREAEAMLGPQKCQPQFTQPTKKWVR